MKKKSDKSNHLHNHNENDNTNNVLLHESNDNNSNNIYLINNPNNNYKHMAKEEDWSSLDEEFRASSKLNSVKNNKDNQMSEFKRSMNKNKTELSNKTASLHNLKDKILHNSINKVKNSIANDSSVKNNFKCSFANNNFINPSDSGNPNIEVASRGDKSGNADPGKPSRKRSSFSRNNSQDIGSEMNSIKNSNGNSSVISRKNSTIRKKEKVNIKFGLEHEGSQLNLTDNTISTTKYSLISFLPNSLLFQFRRAANIYFLIVSIMTCFNFSPKKPSSMIGTFAFVLIATMIKEGFEDYNRYKQDKASNERLTLKLERDGWREVKCSTLKAGQLVKIVKDEEFSADCLIVQSSNSNGYCYIDTKNLDGESNLKEKSAIEEYKNVSDLNSINGQIKCDASNEHLHMFEGVLSRNSGNNQSNLEYSKDPYDRASITTDRSLFINMRNMILKGCTLKNTSWAVGIVIYTGKNTKIMKNSKNPKVKVSKILRIMNVLLYSLFAFTIVLCIVLSGLSVRFKSQNEDQMKYVFNDDIDTLSSSSDLMYFLIRIIIFFVAYSNIIPISLYVALEMVKIFQGVLIFYDNDLFDIETDKAAKCRATDLIEELGQVEFIFSDKTGTLTQNVMLLKKCYIDGELFGTTANKDRYVEGNNPLDFFSKNKKSSEIRSKEVKIYIPNNNDNQININNTKINNYINNNENKDKYGYNNANNVISNRDEGISSKNDNSSVPILIGNQNKFLTTNNMIPNVFDKLKDQENRVLKEAISNKEFNNINVFQDQERKKNVNNNSASNNNKVVNEIELRDIGNDNNFSINLNNNRDVNKLASSENAHDKYKKSNTLNSREFNKTVSVHRKTFQDNVNNRNIKYKRIENEKFTINGDKLAYEMITGTDIEDEMKMKIDEYFTILSLCHSVFPEVIQDEDINYQGSSPDDIALVKGAAQFGYKFISKDYTKLTIKNEIFNEYNTYELLVEMPFDSDRKRMSVVIRDCSTNNLMLFSKGADTIMNKRINWLLGIKVESIDAENEEDILKQINEKAKEEEKYTNEILDTLCKEGLRCLVLGKKNLEEQEFSNWYSRYTSAKEKGRDVSKFFNELETNLEFAGVTAIEDKLQDGVDTTISTLMSCGIRVWVLTGDKEDTALEIGKSCKLIRNNTEILKLTDFECVEKTLIGLIREYKLDTKEFLGEDYYQRLKEEGEFEPPVLFQKEKKRKKKEISLVRIKEQIRNYNHNDNQALIVDGLCLDVILSSPCLSSAFFYIASSCNSVICCRVSPKQKSKVVKVTKVHGSWITLSIGDGANDVPMIMEAHIGVGIQGKEGTQAVRSADFSIGQFRFLEKLILDYGRNAYFKISNFICYYFYKNILLSITEFFFSWYNGYSGQIFFADYLNTMYNAFFTSWPCVLTFIFEKSFSIQVVRNFPILYRAGPLNYFFNMKVFWTYIGYSLYHSVICFFVPIYALQGIVAENTSVHNYNLWYISTVSFSLVVHVATFKLLIISDFWNFLSLLAIVSSIAFYYVCLFVLSNSVFSLMFQPELIGLPYVACKHSRTLLLIVCVPVFCLIVDYMFKQISFIFFPTPNEYLRSNSKVMTALKAESSLSEVKDNKMDSKLSSIIMQRKKTLFGSKVSYCANDNKRDKNNKIIEKSSDSLAYFQQYKAKEIESEILKEKNENNELRKHDTYTSKSNTINSPNDDNKKSASQLYQYNNRSSNESEDEIVLKSSKAQSKKSKVIINDKSNSNDNYNLNKEISEFTNKKNDSIDSLDDDRNEIRIFTDNKVSNENNKDKNTDFNIDLNNKIEEKNNILTNNNVTHNSYHKTSKNEFYTDNLIVNFNTPITPDSNQHPFEINLTTNNIKSPNQKSFTSKKHKKRASKIERRIVDFKSDAVRTLNSDKEKSRKSKANNSNNYFNIINFNITADPIKVNKSNLTNKTDSNPLINLELVKNSELVRSSLLMKNNQLKDILFKESIIENNNEGLEEDEKDKHKRNSMYDKTNQIDLNNFDVKTKKSSKKNSSKSSNSNKIKLNLNDQQEIRENEELNSDAYDNNEDNNGQNMNKDRTKNYFIHSSKNSGN